MKTKVAINIIRGRNLKKLRVDLGLKQPQFAKKMSVSPTTVSHWENGKTKPDLVNAYKIINLAKKSGFDISLEYIYARED